MPKITLLVAINLPHLRNLKQDLAREVNQNERVTFVNPPNLLENYLETTSCNLMNTVTVLTKLKKVSPVMVKEPKRYYINAECILKTPFDICFSYFSKILLGKSNVVSGFDKITFKDCGNFHKLLSHLEKVSAQYQKRVEYLYSEVRGVPLTLVEIEKEFQQKLSISLESKLSFLRLTKRFFESANLYFLDLDIWNNHDHLVFSTLQGLGNTGVPLALSNFLENTRTGFGRDNLNVSVFPKSENYLQKRIIELVGDSPLNN